MSYKPLKFVSSAIQEFKKPYGPSIMLIRYARLQKLADLMSNTALTASNVGESGRFFCDNIAMSLLLMGHLQSQFDSRESRHQVSSSSALCC